MPECFWPYLFCGIGGAALVVLAWYAWQKVQVHRDRVDVGESLRDDLARTVSLDPAPRPRPELTQSDVDDFVRKVRGPGK